MNVLLFTTYKHGGAGTACRRLQEALTASGETANLLTAGETPSKWPFYAERLSFLPFERDKTVRFAFSLANFGHDLSRHRLAREADILHLHWINQGFLSLKNIRQLAALGKPVVWTLHDMWAFTGGCHYSGDCLGFRLSCGMCPYLRAPGPGDLSHRIWKKKQEQLPENIHFVTCSEWLAGEARSSSLLRDYPVTAIPNPIDADVFKPLSPAERMAFRQSKGIGRDALLLLFVAMKVKETRKGFHLLLRALQELKNLHPALPVELLVLGQSDPAELQALPYPYHALGLVRDTASLVSVYGAADVFVIPSLEDNLPNTVMESMACGTPVAGFETGGIPEMVGHLQEGFIAPQGDSEALAKGIYRLARGETPVDTFRKAAREKVERQYANAAVGEQYIRLYRNLLTTPRPD
ncbi:MAG: glycosyltransferase family 4 protein [Thermoanaerobaculia bacterium]|nr:glycosyltransferase family 4 protein [Thermoanaerobaculia bacterium]